MRKLPLVGTVIHATKGQGVAGALKKVKTSAVTWHFTIDRDGTIFQHLAMDRVSDYHAGRAVLTVRGQRETLRGRRLSRRTIGIELANAGPHVQRPRGSGRNFIPLILPPRSGAQWAIPRKDTGSGKYLRSSLVSRDEMGRRRGRFNLEQVGTLCVEGACEPVWWEAYSILQINALVRLLRALRKTRWRSAGQVIVGHSEIAMRPIGRKADPGLNFPWKQIRSRELHVPLKEPLCNGKRCDQGTANARGGSP